MSRLNQAGDTIVEVLVAMLVVSVVMAGAFVSTRRSSTATRRSEERVEGLKTAEEQVERLKVLAGDPADNGSLFVPFPTASNEFCIDGAGTRQNLTGIYITSVAADTFPGVYPGGCPRTTGGVSYYPAIIRTVVGTTYTFAVHVRWEAAGGGINQETTLSYRTYR